jgi:hypothetical protein
LVSPQEATLMNDANEEMDELFEKLLVEFGLLTIWAETCPKLIPLRTIISSHKLANPSVHFTIKKSKSVEKMEKVKNNGL